MPKPTDKQQGFVLIITLWLILGLAAIALTFGHSSLMEYRSNDNAHAALQAEHALQAAVLYAKEILAQTGADDLPDPEEWMLDAVEVGEGGFWLFAPQWGDEAETEEPTFGIIDEAAKLNLNTMTKDMLLSLPGMTEEIAAAIIDWRDTDEEVSEYGAETETYSRKSPAYQSKNSDFECIEELLLVDGVTEKLLFGKDRNRNGRIDEWENDSTSSISTNNDTDYGIAHLLTVHNVLSQEQESGQEDGQGNQTINVTTSRQEEIVQRLRERLGSEKATQAGAGAGSRSLLEFYVRSGLSKEEFEQIEDSLTSGANTETQAPTNVNHAIRAVLRCLPGIGKENVEKLIAYREQHSDSLESVAWLGEVLDREDAILAGPYVTTHSSSVSLDVIAIGFNGRATRRARFYFDLSGETPALRLRKDYSHLHWALGEKLWEDVHSGSWGEAE